MMGSDTIHSDAHEGVVPSCESRAEAARIWREFSASVPEFRTINVQVHRDKRGLPTCCAEWATKQCQFLQVRRMGLVETCGATAQDIPRDADGYGWLRPVPGCPVWGDAK